MRKPTPQDLKELNLLKHYRIIRKWACKANGLNDADLELLIYLDSLEHFSKQDFKTGQYSFSWNNRRWNNLNKTRLDKSMETSEIELHKSITFIKHLLNLSFYLSRMYRIMLGEEDLPDNKEKEIIYR